MLLFQLFHISISEYNKSFILSFTGDQYFLTLPKFTPGKVAILQSPSFNEQAPGSEVQSQFDFRLWLNMQGEHTGRFEVGLNTDTLDDTVYYHDTPTNSWQQIEFSVNVAGPFSVSYHNKIRLLYI